MAEQRARPSAIFRLDGARGDLTADGTVVALPPKALALLLYLVENASRVVPRAELVEIVWEGVSVSADAIRYAVKQVRRGLADSATEPLFIETVSRRGWCFVGRATPVAEDCWILEGRGEPDAPRSLGTRSALGPFVGREPELGALLDVLSRAQTGERRTLFLRGEPGIGKSRLLNVFLDTASLRADALTARGECVDHVGPGMPYAPLFEVLERICERLGSATAIDTLRRHAPTWLAQMPSLTEPDDRASLEEQIQGATQARMIREWTRVIERFADERTLVIAIEDVHWADPSTLLALFYFATRADSSRVLLVATLRPDPSTPALAGLQKAIDEFASRDDCGLLTPSAFDLEAVHAYLGARFGHDQPATRSEELRAHLCSASGGNPLFLTSLVDELVEKESIRKRDDDWVVTDRFSLESVPETLTPLIERQLAGLAPDLRELLEAASIAGMDFTASELAAALQKTIDNVERGCERLVADGRFVVPKGAVAWPDGTVGSGYRFAHDLHRAALFSGLAPGRQARLSLAIAERLRDAYAGREDEIAAELAVLFERGLALGPAAEHYARAGEASARRFANFEAVGHFRRALKLLTQSELEGGDLLEIRTRLALCAPLASVAGYAAPELEDNLGRLETLTADLEDSVEMFPALLGLWSLNFVRADFARTEAFGARMLALAERAASPAMRLQAHQSVGHSHFYRGGVLKAQHHYDAALKGYDVAGHERQDYSVGDDPLVLVLTCRALSYWFLGRSDEACASAEEAVRHGERLGHPPSLALAWTYGAVLHQLRGDVARASEWSDRSLEITTTEGIPFWMELSRIVRGWSIANTDHGTPAEGIEMIRSGIAGWNATGSKLGLPHFLSLLATSLGRAGEFDEALDVLVRARESMEATGQDVFRSQIHRLEGDLLRRRSVTRRAPSDLEDARAAYSRAAEEAERRSLKANALQAWTALADLDGPGAPSTRRLAELAALYPLDTKTDLDLAYTRERLSATD